MVVASATPGSREQRRAEDASQAIADTRQDRAALTAVTSLIAARPLSADGAAQRSDASGCSIAGVLGGLR